MQLNAERGTREGVERERECKHACVVWGSSGGPQKREVLVSCDVAAARVRVDGAGLGQREKETRREGGEEMATAAATAAGETLVASRMTHLLD